MAAQGNATGNKRKGLGDRTQQCRRKWLVEWQMPGLGLKVDRCCGIYLRDLDAGRHSIICATERQQVSCAIDDRSGDGNAVFSAVGDCSADAWQGQLV